MCNSTYKIKPSKINGQLLIILHIALYDFFPYVFFLILSVIYQVKKSIPCKLTGAQLHWCNALEIQLTSLVLFCVEGGPFVACMAEATESPYQLMSR